MRRSHPRSALHDITVANVLWGSIVSLESPRSSTRLHCAYEDTRAKLPIVRIPQMLSSSFALILTRRVQQMGHSLTCAQCTDRIDDTLCITSLHFLTSTVRKHKALTEGTPPMSRWSESSFCPMICSLLHRDTARSEC